MTSVTMNAAAEQLFRQHQDEVYRRTDRMFGVLMVLQWLAGIGAALWISPRAWSGTASSLHPHVTAAIVLGSLVTALPVYLAWRHPGHALTRHIIAISQMLVSALLIHFTGGRIETHFHVFGSLAFLACYRDWRVLISATAVVVIDHLLRGWLWPYSVFGVMSAPIWRSIEHGGWVVFEDLFLIVAIRQSVAEMQNVAVASQAKSEAVAQLHQSQEALRNQSRILESVLSSMGDGVVVADTGGNLLVFNPTAERILHKGRSDTRPEEWTEHYHLYLADTITPYPIDELPLVRAIRGESSDAVEMYVRPQDSRDGVWINLNGRPLRGADGGLLGGVVVFRDVTAAKRSEEMLHNAKRAAEAANTSKTAFLANMSHEIRTPLSSILGFSELLRRGVGTPEERNVYLDTISSSGRHLSALIDDVLDLSKIEAGRMEFERVQCSPHQIMTEVLSVLRVRAQQKALSLEGRWMSGVPETILTDPARLRQLLMNLVGNAIKFTEQGSVTLVSSVDREGPEPRLSIEVRDTGIGIPPDRIEGVFNPFEQADSSITRRFGGTGLGLAISRHIAQGLGGEIQIESTPHSGSTFRVRLETGPLEGVRFLSDPPTEALVSAPAAGAAESGFDLSGLRVLLVEDGQSNQQLISLVLEQAGAEVTCAGNGREGVTSATRSQFDLILMDMQMPVMDGYTATECLRNLGYELPIIALTAHAMRGDREKCLAAGCSGYLTKPINIDELLRTVASMARQPHEQPQADNPAVKRPSNGSPSAAGPLTSTLSVDNPRFRPIIESFIDRLRHNLATMQSAADGRDWKTVAELAHWLHGSGGTVGFGCFTDPARRLEQHAKGQQSEAMQAAIDEIVGLADRITVAV